MLKFSLVLLLVFFVGGAFAVNGVPDGFGTLAEPYQIADYEDLKVVRNFPDAYYLLVADINASASRNEVNGFPYVGTFTGHFNGAGHSITGLYIKSSSSGNVGLFGTVSDGIIDSLAVHGEVTGFRNIGLIAGTMENNSELKNSYANGLVVGPNNAGGLIGYVHSNSKVSNSYASVRVESKYSDAAGLIGELASSSIVENCYSSGRVLKGGGLIAKRYTSTSVLNSYWNLDLAGQTKSVGGTGLRNQKMRESTSFSGWDFNTTWEINEGNTFPGLKGLNDAPYGIPDSFHSMPGPLDHAALLLNDVDLEGTAAEVLKFINQTELNTSGDSLYLYYIPGELLPSDDTLWGVESYVAVPNDTIEIATYEDLKKVGRHWNYPINARYKLVADIDATVSKTENGDLGFEPIGTIEEPFTGEMNGAGFVISGLYINRTTRYVGLFGNIENATIQNLGVIGNVSGEAYVGMLVGQVGESSLIIRTFSGGIVSRGNVLGGLVGENLGRIQKSYSTATVQGGNGIGGLVGYNDNSIWRCYSSGLVLGDGRVGGLTSYTSRDGRVSSSYWNVEVSGQNTSDGGTGLTSSEMLDSNSYYWDFENTWEIIQGQSYPGIQIVDDAPFGISDSHDSIPQDYNFDQFLSNDIDVETGAASATVSTFAEYARINSTRDSVYLYYFMGVTTINTDTIISGISYVAVPNDTIGINNYDELKLIGNHNDYPLYGSYKLLNTIDASLSREENGGAGFMPIGDATEPFTGVLDGAGHEIYGLYVHRPDSSNVGLFGVIQSGKIENLGVKGTFTGRSSVATIAGKISDASVISKSYGIGIIKGRSHIGGLVGYSSMGSIITRSYSSGQVLGYENVGGLLGEVSTGSEIYNSYSTAGVAGESSTGGFVGETPSDPESYTIINCYSAGIPLDNNYNIGLGISRSGVIYNGRVISRADESPTIVGNYWNVNTLGIRILYYGSPLTSEAMKRSSSFDGWDFATIWEIREGETYPGLRDVDDMQFGMPDSFNTLPGTQDYNEFLTNDVDVDSDDSDITVFKLTNFYRYTNNRDSISIVYFPGVVESPDDTTWAGPSTFTIPNDTILISSYEELKKIGNEQNYPLFGNYRLTNDINATLSQTENGGKGFAPIGKSENSFSGTFDGGGHVIYNLFINRPTEDTIGLFEKLSGGLIQNVGVSGEIVAGNYTGLLVGILDSGSTITNSYTTGSINAESYTGGLVGAFEHWSNIIDCYSTADVSGETRVGGLVGEQDNSRNGNVFGYHKQSYSTGFVDGVWGVGGLIGSVSDYNKPTGIYWDINTSGQIDSEGGEGRTTYSMQNRSTYSGWSFNSIWTLLDQKSYPGLMMVNNAPMAFRDNLEIATTSALSQVLLNDYDIEQFQQALVVKVDSIFGIGTSDSVTQFSFPSGTADGVVDSIKYQVGEVLAQGDTLWGNFAIAVFTQTLNNLAPIAVQDGFILAEDTEVLIDITTLILNDIDAPTETLVFDSIISKSVRTGSVTITGDEMKYVPDVNWNGRDTVEYVMNDGVFKDTGYVVLSVTPVNDVPVLTAINPQVTNEDIPITIVDAMVSASDVDGDTWTYLIEEKTGYTVSNNVIVPNLNYTGELTIPISIYDGQAESVKRDLILTVNPVNDVPKIISVTPQTIAEDSELLFIETMVQVTDVEGDAITFLIGTGRNYTVQDMNIVPNRDFNGTLHIPVYATDGLDTTAESILELVVIATNDSPLFTSIDAQVIQEDKSLIFKSSMTNGSDVDNDPLTYIIEGGTHYVVDNTNITPSENFNGILTIPVRVSDGSDTTAPVNLVLTVIPVNDAPTLSRVSSGIIEQKEKLILDLSMTDASDIDNDRLSFVVEKGSNYLVISGNGILPLRNFMGGLLVPVRVTDGIDTSASVNMIIEVVPKGMNSSNESTIVSSVEQQYSSRGAKPPESLSSESNFIDTTNNNPISSVEQIGGVGQSSSSEDVSSALNSPINTSARGHNGVSSMFVSNIGSSGIIIAGPEAATNFRIYTVHGEFIESGALQNGMANISEYAPQGLLVILFK
ncbi:MAG: cadherin-like domain-containing protein [Fibrobacterales bacterium]